MINQMWRNDIMITAQAKIEHDCPSSYAIWDDKEKVWKCGLCKKIVKW